MGSKLTPKITAWCGFTLVSSGRGLINFQATEEARALETYATWARLFELLPHCSWILDRFHVSTGADGDEGLWARAT